MKRFIARFTKTFEIGQTTYKKGDEIILEESTDYAPAYWIVYGDEFSERSNDMLTNEYGTVFALVGEIQKAA